MSKPPPLPPHAGPFGQLPPPRKGLHPGLIAVMIVVPVGLVMCLLLSAMLVPALSRARETANRVKCASNLRQIGQAIAMYAGKHGGAYPPDFSTLLATGQIPVRVFECPSSHVLAPTGTLPAGWADAEAPYVYLGKGLTTSIGPEVVVAMDRDLSNHDGDGGNLLFGDGRVEWMSKAELPEVLAGSEKLIAEWRAGRPGGGR